MILARPRLILAGVQTALAGRTSKINIPVEGDHLIQAVLGDMWRRSAVEPLMKTKLQHFPFTDDGQSFLLILCFALARLPVPLAHIG